ncbi:nicotinate phosphoribosyltransferase [Methylocystis heyeri]|uniref:Nicotinamide phosphoribosyltransferase n=1 Tax=Methylocystis heyeri TaxID=391905 RepID=A0A6B8K8D2_9HYPH|nr:nicotinate phosphoribosyltransferase [Methylocystis heyeri]QGM44474.1 nicotinate phosphoribosyltransferase [Methylocystis heyeri]
MTNFDNLILDVDSYKASHYLQYPPGAEYVSSYIESRGGAWPETLFFGLQIYLKNVLTKPISRSDIDEAEAVFRLHGEPFNREGWEHILKAHKGFMPVRIQAVREGIVLPTRNALVQIVNTDPEIPWIVSYLETALLRAVWYPTTVATRSLMIKKLISTALEETSDDPAGQLAFKLHDFGARGVSSKESAGIGSVAHLVNFRGTDTISALLTAQRFYDAPMAGLSIPASEHSTMTAWGQDGETSAYANMLRRFGGPGKTFAVVSDSYDVYRAVADIWGGTLKSEVETMGGTLVVRPDSGDPTVVPVNVIEILAEKFGSRINGKGFRVLPDCIRVIQGDGVNERTIAAILANLKAKGFAADNIAFGMGGALLQALDRDTMKFAMKASAIRFNGDGWRDVFKNPATDPGKASKKGRLALLREDSDWRTIREDELHADAENLLEDVFVDGRLMRDQSLDEIRRLSWP